MVRVLTPDAIISPVQDMAYNVLNDRDLMHKALDTINKVAQAQMQKNAQAQQPQDMIFTGDNAGVPKLAPSVASSPPPVQAKLLPPIRTLVYVDEKATREEIEKLLAEFKKQAQAKPELTLLEYVNNLEGQLPIIWGMVIFPKLKETILKITSAEAF